MTICSAGLPYLCEMATLVFPCLVDYKDLGKYFRESTIARANITALGVRIDSVVSSHIIRIYRGGSLPARVGMEE